MNEYIIIYLIGAICIFIAAITASYNEDNCLKLWHILFALVLSSLSWFALVLSLCIRYWNKPFFKSKELKDEEQNNQI